MNGALIVRVEKNVLCVQAPPRGHVPTTDSPTVVGRLPQPTARPNSSSVCCICGNGAHTYTHTRKNTVSYSRASANGLQSKAKDAASLCPPGYKGKFTGIFIGISRAHRRDATLGNRSRRSFGPCV